MLPVVNRVPMAVRCLVRRPSSADIVVRNFWNHPRSIASSMDTAFGHVDHRELRNLDRFFDTFGRYRSMRHRIAFPWFFDFARRPIDHEYELPIDVEDDGRGRRLAIKVDVSQFKPEEVKVTVSDDHVLTIRATHVEEKSEDGGRVLREYVRQYTLPNDVVTNSIKSLLAEDGTLTVEAPLPAVENEAPSKEIPIERQSGSKSKTMN